MRFDDIDLGVLDLNRYDFDGLRAELAHILEVRSAVADTAKLMVLVPLGGAVVASLLFFTRTNAFALIFFVLVLMVLLAIVAFGIGIIRAVGVRVDRTNAAADRVLTTVTSMHRDYLGVRSGDIELPTQAIANKITREVVFPTLAAVGSRAAARAAATVATRTGPTGFLAGQILRYALGHVEDRLVKALQSGEEKPVAELPPPPAVDARPEVLTGELIDTGIRPELPEEAQAWYGSARERLSRIVGGVGWFAKGSVGLLVLLTSVVALMWMALGWLAL